MEAIQTIDLTKFYGRSRGIQNLNLRVEEGEFFGFIGPNGAGKSTTIRTLLGLISATSGSAEVLGRPVGREKTAILEQVGYLPSEAVFYEGMRVRDVLRLSAELRRKDCSAEAGRLCERLQLDPAKRVGELSFGNRKKVGIVCALQSDPALLILDEPTGGLDPLMQREFFDVLRERNRQGRTVFLSSHILSEVQQNCTRAAVIRDGSIIACDSVDALAKTNAKRVSYRGSVDLSGLAGVKDLRADPGGGSFLYSGDLHLLLARFAAGTIKALNLSEPDLAEIFLHYYEKGGGAS